MVFLGDVHTKFDKLNLREDKEYLQVGDLGIGMAGYPYPEQFQEGFKFIRGNHDNPAACKEHPNYLGDWGFLLSMDLFYVSGAYSIDWKRRVPGLDFWNGEELKSAEFEKCVDLYRKTRPRYMVSHDCPDSVRELLFPHTDKKPSATSHYLELMLQIHKPEYWIFGHYHETVRKELFKVKFACLSIFGTFELPELYWRNE